MLPWLLSNFASWGTLRTAPAHIRVGTIWHSSLEIRPAMGGAIRQHRLFSSEQPSPTRAFRSMVTLDPLQMATMGQQVYDISGMPVARLRTPENALLSLSYKSFRRGRETVAIPFPPGTKGIFYYYLSPGCPPQAGELRFKKCGSAQQFHEGEDLQVDTCQPWSSPLINLVQSTCKKPFLHELLVKPGLVDHKVVVGLQRGVSEAKDPHRGLGFSQGRLTLYDINQPFVIDLHIIDFTARLVSRQSIQRIRVVDMFWLRRYANSPMLPPPFRGRVRARFEISDSAKDEGRLTLHLRILDILEPIEHRIVQDLVEEPRAGELLSRRKKKHLDFTPWSYSPKAGGKNHTALVEFLKCRAADKAKFGV